MALNYLEDQTQNIYAAGQMGRTFSDALKMRGLAQIEAMKWQQQQAMERAYLDLEQQKMARSAQESDLRMRLEGERGQRESEQFRTQQALAQQRQQLGTFDIEQAKASAELARRTMLAQQQAAFATRMLHPVDMSQGPTLGAQRQLNQSDLAEALATIGYSQPAVAGRMLEPMPLSPGSAVYDPISMQKLADVPYMPRPESPFEAARLAETQRHNRAVEAQRGEISPRDLANIIGAYRYDKTAPARVAAEQRLGQTLGVSGGRVTVRSKDGQIGTIPAEQLQDALAEGYTQVQ